MDTANALAGSNMNVTAAVYNQDLKTASRIKVAFYQVQGSTETKLGEESLVKTIGENNLFGGKSYMGFI